MHCVRVEGSGGMMPQAFKLTTDITGIKSNMLPLSEVMRVDETAAAVSKPMLTGKPQAAVTR